MNAYDRKNSSEGPLVEPDYESIFGTFPLLETPRLKLRAIVPLDAPAILDIFSDDEVTKYYDLYSYHTLDEARELIDFFAESFEVERGIRWGIVRKEDNSLIGTCGYVWLRRFRGEIGYELNRSYWRKGYMGEALQAICEFGFNALMLNRIEATVMVQNHASANLLLKNNFREEGTMRQHDYFKDAFHDMRLFSLLYQDK